LLPAFERINRLGLCQTQLLRCTNTRGHNVPESWLPENFYSAWVLYNAATTPVRDETQLDPTPDRLKKKGFYLRQNLTREQKPIWPTIIQGAQGTQDRKSGKFALCQTVADTFAL
jgi:hypothetical protein